MEEKVRTRSQRAGHPERWTQVPVLVKIFKLIIYELSNAIDTNMGKDELNVRFRYFKGDYQLWLVDDRWIEPKIMKHTFGRRAHITEVQRPLLRLKFSRFSPHLKWIGL